MKQVKFEFEATDLKYLAPLRKLSTRQCDVLVLANQGVGYAASAATLGIPEGTVKSSLHRARNKIIKWRAEDALKATMDKMNDDFQAAIKVMELANKVLGDK